MDINIDNLWIILNYSYDEEINHLEEILEEDLPESLEDSIKLCEDKDMTDHIAYSLMILKQNLQKI